MGNLTLSANNARRKEESRNYASVFTGREVKFDENRFFAAGARINSFVRKEMEKKYPRMEKIRMEKLNVEQVFKFGAAGIYAKYGEALFFKTGTGRTTITMSIVKSPGTPSAAENPEFMAEMEKLHSECSEKMKELDDEERKITGSVIPKCKEIVYNELKASCIEVRTRNPGENIHIEGLSPSLAKLARARMLSKKEIIGHARKELMLTGASDEKLERLFDHVHAGVEEAKGSLADAIRQFIATAENDARTLSEFVKTMNGNANAGKPIAQKTADSKKVRQAISNYLVNVVEMESGERIALLALLDESNACSRIGGKIACRNGNGISASAIKQAVASELSRINTNEPAAFALSELRKAMDGSRA